MSESPLQQMGFLSLRDLLQGGKVYEHIYQYAPEFLDENARELDRTYSVKSLAIFKRKMMSKFMELAFGRKFYLEPWLEYLPANVLLSFPTMEKVLDNHKLLDLVETQRLTYRGLVAMCESGKV
jgi:hypothetical protein